VDERDAERSLREIRSLRRQGQITPREAYERHLDALRALSEVPAPSAPPPAPEAEEQTAEDRLALDVLAVALALIGGALGIAGAFVQELQSFGFGILLAIAGAPIIEEALKPAGVYLLLVRWPRALRGQLHTALLAALAGVVFGLIESLAYVKLYFPDAGSSFVLYRFTVPVTMHALSSFIVGLGLDRGVIDWAAGRAPLPKQTRDFFIAGAGLHAAYNLSVVVLSVAGVFEFD